jgi:hypothetical protein
VLTRINGEPRVAITHRNLETWDDLRTFPKKHLHRKSHVILPFHVVILELNRGKMKVLPSGFKTYRSSVENLETSPCRTARMTNA